MKVETINCGTDSIEPETLLNRLLSALDDAVVEAAEGSSHTVDVFGYVDQYRVVLMGGDFPCLTIEKRHDAADNGVRDVTAKFSA